jgi:hypothetical protein
MKGALLVLLLLLATVAIWGLLDPSVGPGGQTVRPRRQTRRRMRAPRKVRR